MGYDTFLRFALDVHGLFAWEAVHRIGCDEVPLLTQPALATLWIQGPITTEEDRKKLPLLDVWEQWYADRPAKLKDADGFELLRTLVWTTVSEWDYKDYESTVKKRPDLKAAVRATACSVE